jgi:hypothetical protein
MEFNAARFFCFTPQDNQVIFQRLVLVHSMRKPVRALKGRLE